MEQLDRLDMLKQLTFIGDKNISIFSSYIPDHYDEIYSLYSLLKEASLNYKNIEFERPKEKDDAFIFFCRMDEEYMNIFNAFLANIENKISFMRNKSFFVASKELDDRFQIKFKKI